MLLYLISCILLINLASCSWNGADTNNHGNSNENLFVLKAHEEGQFARYQSSIPLKNFNLQNQNDVFGAEQNEPSSTLPLVVVAIPTFNRAHFLIQSLEYVRRQQYPRDRLAVAILDDSELSLEENDDFMKKIVQLQQVGIKVYYKHRDIIPQIGQENIGQKRNSIVRWIKYELITNEHDFIIIHWDDDDWQAPHRIMKQVMPLVNGQSEISALDLHTILLLHENQVYTKWVPTGKSSTPMPIMNVNGGTLCYWASVWNDHVQFPNLGCGEDIMFVDRVMHANNGTHRVTILDDSDLAVIYLRHEGNTWSGLDASSWVPTTSKLLPPRFQKDISFYQNMKYWKKPKWDGKFQKDQLHWWCSNGIEKVNTLVVNEIRGISNTM